MTGIKKLLTTYRNSNIVVRAGIWFLLVTVIDKGIAVITQPIVNRILSVEEVGVFGVYNSWRSVFAVLATFNLFGGILEVHLTKTPEEKNDVVASLCSLSLLISLIFWFVFFLFGNQLSAFLGLKKIYLVFMALAITAETIIHFWTVPKRFEYLYKPYALLIVGLFIVKTTASVLLTYFLKEDRVLGRIVGLAVPPLIVAVVLLVQIIYRGQKSRLTAYWKHGFLFNLPLIPHYLSSILLASSDKIMIQKLSGKADAGLYTVAYSFSSLALIVFNALNNTYNPISMKAIKSKNYSALRKSTELIIILSVGFSVLMMLLAPEGIWLLGGDKYLGTVDIIPVLIVGIYFSSFYFVFSNVEFVYEKNKLIFPITLCGAVINIGLNYYLIPILGYKAAAYTTFIGYLFIAVSHYLVSRKILGEDIYNIKRIIVILTALFLGSFVSMILYRHDNIIRHVCIGCIVVVGTIIAYKRKAQIISLISKKSDYSS